MKIRKIELHRFAGFSDVEYDIVTGEIVGGAATGKTSILNAVIAAMVNTDMSGSRGCPINDEASVAWVKLHFDEAGQSEICHRTWVKTSSGVSSKSTFKVDNKESAIAILNPLHILSLAKSDRQNFIAKVVYGGKPIVLADIIPQDVPDSILDVADSIEQATLHSLEKSEELYKNDLKKINSDQERYHVLVDIYSELGKSTEGFLKEIDKLNEEASAIREVLGAIHRIKYFIFRSAAEVISKELSDAEFDDDGGILWCGKCEKMLSKNENMYCALEIANAVAKNATLVPPTLVEDWINSYEIDKDNYPYLGQFITTNFANVKLAEKQGNVLKGIEEKFSVIPRDHIFVRSVIEEMEFIE